MNRMIILIMLLCVILRCWSGDRQYDIKGLLLLNVSDKLELRQSDDEYTQGLTRQGIIIETENRFVFQQQNLNKNDKQARELYARIIIDLIEDENCTLPACNDGNFSQEDIEILKTTVENELAPGTFLVCDPQTSVQTNAYGNKYVEIKYQRTGLYGKGNVNVSLCYFFNYSYMAKIVFSYRAREAHIWQKIMLNAQKNLAWKNPYILNECEDEERTREICTSSNSSEKSKKELVLMAIFALCVLVVGFIVLRGFVKVRYTKKFLDSFDEMIQKGYLTSAEMYLQSLEKVIQQKGSLKMFNMAKTKLEKAKQSTDRQINELMKMSIEAQLIGDNVKAQYLADSAIKLSDLKEK